VPKIASSETVNTLRESRVTYKLLHLGFAVIANVDFSVCPVLFAAYFAGGFSNHALVFLLHLHEWSASWWKNYSSFVAERCTGRTMNCIAAAPAFGGVGNYCLSIPIIEHSIRTKFYASWLSSFRTQPSHFSSRIMGNQGPVSSSKKNHLRLFESSEIRDL